MARFVETGRLEETFYFGPQPEAALTYALVRHDFAQQISVESASQRIAVILPAIEVAAWSATEQVGISAEVDLGSHGILTVLVEKDFACLDRSGGENADTFPNPHAAHVC
jgi:hypothetical protein